VLLSIVNDSGSGLHTLHGDRVDAVPPVPQLSRRAVLALGTTALLVVGGCTGSDDPTPEGNVAPTDPDRQLVDRVVESITETAAAVTAAQTAAPALRRPTWHLARMHEEHLAALDAAAASSTAPAPAATDAAAALAVVRRRERQLQRQLSAAALQAESGTLARLLASMGAAVSQALAALPEEVA
jgi:hypothetical protein